MVPSVATTTSPARTGPRVSWQHVRGPVPGDADRLGVIVQRPRPPTRPRRRAPAVRRPGWTAALRCTTSPPSNRSDPTSARDGVGAEVLDLLADRPRVHRPTLAQVGRRAGVVRQLDVTGSVPVAVDARARDEGVDALRRRRPCRPTVARPSGIASSAARSCLVPGCTMPPLRLLAPCPTTSPSTSTDAAPGASELVGGGEPGEPAADDGHVGLTRQRRRSGGRCQDVPSHQTASPRSPRRAGRRTGARRPGSPPWRKFTRRHLLRSADWAPVWAPAGATASRQLARQFAHQKERR